MQYRHLYYFVKIVEAGSFSQAARTIHVAQPALSQQIAELEASLGMPLLQRSARGVRPTAAGQRFYEEASSILRRYEALPGLVRSGMGEVAGLVSLGMPASLSTTLVGPFIEQCRSAYPKVILKFIDGDSEFLREEVEKSRLDLALAFEDEFFPVVLRRPLFRQNHYLISSARTAPAAGPTISLEDVAKVPLILPGQLNARRIVINRTFVEAGFSLESGRRSRDGRERALGRPVGRRKHDPEPRRHVGIFAGRFRHAGADRADLLPDLLHHLVERSFALVRG